MKKILFLFIQSSFDDRNMYVPRYGRKPTMNLVNRKSNFSARSEECPRISDKPKNGPM
jgi:hypothetical protein